MTTKNNFKKQRKDSQRRKERAVKNAATNHANRSKPKSKRRHPEYSDEFVRDYIREHGISRAVIDLKLQPTDQEFTNKDVAAMISESIPPLVRLHSGIEILDRLAKEGSVQLPPEHLAIITEFDKLITRFNENVEACITMMDVGREPADYMVIIQDLTDNLMDLMMDYRDALIGIMEGYTEAIEEYAKEHRGEEEPMYDFMLKLHTQRMVTVFPLYRTETTGLSTDAEFDLFDAQAVAAAEEDVETEDTAVSVEQPTTTQPV